jgi:hypothetical protein
MTNTPVITGGVKINPRKTKIVPKRHVSQESESERGDDETDELLANLFSKVRVGQMKKPKVLHSVRPKSVRVQTIRAAKAEKVTVSSTKPSKKTVSKVATSAVASIVAKKSKKIKPGNFDIIKRQFHTTYEFPRGYLEEFSLLFNRHRDQIKELIQNDANNNQEILTGVELNKRLIEAIDDIYFQFRDELIISLGMRKRELESMME